MRNPACRRWSLAKTGLPPKRARERPASTRQAPGSEGCSVALCCQEQMVHQARDAAGSAEKVSLSFTLPVCTGGLFEEVGDRGFARAMVMNLSKRNRPSRAVERLHSRVIATSRTNLPVSIGKRSPNMTDGRNWLAWSMDPAALE